MVGNETIVTTITTQVLTATRAYENELCCKCKHYKIEAGKHILRGYCLSCFTDKVFIVKNFQIKAVEYINENKTE